jgi:hypothetical protein
MWGRIRRNQISFPVFEIWWRMRRNQISSYWVWNMMAHAQKPDKGLLDLKYDGTCTGTRFCLTGFEIWWHLHRKHISFYWVWNMMAHGQKPDFFYCVWNMMAYAQKPDLDLLGLKYNNIIIFIYCKWVVARWQWLNIWLLTLEMGGLHEKHAVSTWNLVNHLSICL